MNKPKKLAKCAVLLVAASILLCATAPSASAQWRGGYRPWGFNPYMGGLGWLGFNNYYGYGYGYPGYRRWGYSPGPYYVAAAVAPLMMAGSYFAQQSLMNNYFRNMNNMNNMNVYGGYSMPPQAMAANAYGYGGNPAYAPVQAAAYQMPAPAMVANGYAGNGQMMQAQTPAYYPPPAQPAWSAPQIAPSPNQPTYMAAVSSPLAQGFVDLVNSQYQGDIARALLDPNVRTFAHSVGLLNSNNETIGSAVTPQKTETIRGMLSDSKEDPATKISAVRMVLTH